WTIGRGHCRRQSKIKSVSCFGGIPRLSRDNAPVSRGVETVRKRRAVGGGDLRQRAVHPQQLHMGASWPLCRLAGGRGRPWGGGGVGGGRGGGEEGGDRGGRRSVGMRSFAVPPGGAGNTPRLAVRLFKPKNEPTRHFGTQVKQPRAHDPPESALLQRRERCRI